MFLTNSEINAASNLSHESQRSVLSRQGPYPPLQRFSGASFHNYGIENLLVAPQVLGFSDSSTPGQKPLDGCPKHWVNSEEKDFLAVMSQGIPQSHITPQTSHKRFIGRDTKTVAASTKGRSSRELRRRQVYIGFLGKQSFPG